MEFYEAVYGLQHRIETLAPSNIYFAVYNEFSKSKIDSSDLTSLSEVKDAIRIIGKAYQYINDNSPGGGLPWLPTRMDDDVKNMLKESIYLMREFFQELSIAYMSGALPCTANDKNVKGFAYASRKEVMWIYICSAKKVGPHVYIHEATHALIGTDDGKAITGKQGTYGKDNCERAMIMVDKSIEELELRASIASPGDEADLDEYKMGFLPPADCLTGYIMSLEKVGPAVSDRYYIEQATKEAVMEFKKIKMVLECGSGNGYGKGVTIVSSLVSNEVEDYHVPGRPLMALGDFDNIFKVRGPAPVRCNGFDGYEDYRLEIVPALGSVVGPTIDLSRSCNLEHLPPGSYNVTFISTVIVYRDTDVWAYDEPELLGGVRSEDSFALLIGTCQFTIGSRTHSASVTPSLSGSHESIYGAFDGE